jgi:glycosyltransferase involved in cell wall biosynthesis
VSPPALVLRIAYLVNQYPKVSHSFIRREILALERQGVEVLRVALRGWDGELADAEDESERRRTRYALRGGLAGLALATLRTMLASPVRFFGALSLAMRMSRGADRSLPYHLAYLAEACRVLPWLREFEAEHLHAHFGTNGAEIAMLIHALGGPTYSFTVHGPEEFDRPVALKLREKIAGAEFVVAISSYGQAQLMRWAGHADWPKIRVVHCGVDSGFQSAAAAAVTAAPRLVCVGRLSEQKGQLILIDALARLAARGVACELVLAGDGEMRREVEHAVARHGVQASVRITGWIDGEQVRQELLAARALVLPSFAEGLPVVIMESLALRRPVVTTYVAGIPELVRPQENGWLVPAGDVEALADAMQEVLSRAPDALAEMGERGRARVLERHSIDTEASKLLAHFARAAGRDAATRALERAVA